MQLVLSCRKDFWPRPIEGVYINMGFILSGMFLRDSVLYWSFFCSLWPFIYFWKYPCRSSLEWKGDLFLWQGSVADQQGSKNWAQIRSLLFLTYQQVGFISINDWCCFKYFQKSPPVALIMFLPTLQFLFWPLSGAHGDGSSYPFITLNPTGNLRDEWLEKAWTDWTHPFSEWARREEIYS